ncbi:UNVERIFIED_CONTAM: hypothetical protein FKN15_030880 [Acipenser sinensis]
MHTDSTAHSLTCSSFSLVYLTDVSGQPHSYNQAQCCCWKCSRLYVEPPNVTAALLWLVNPASDSLGAGIVCSAVVEFY